MDQYGPLLNAFVLFCSGATGRPGDLGATGQSGPRGYIGATGTVGQIGSTGVRGKGIDAYELIWVSQIVIP